MIGKNSETKRLDILASKEYTKISKIWLKIDTFEELLKHERQILKRIAETPNGGNLFMIHPFLLFEDIGVKLSENAKAQIIATKPWLSTLSSTPYKALKNSKSPRIYNIHLNGLFGRR